MLDYLPLLAHLQDAFHRGIGEADGDAVIPGCPDWTVAQLVGHVAYIHHWAAAQARQEQAEPLSAEGDLGAHYAACARELRDALAGLDPEASALTLDGEGVVSFWHRRQVHETLIHLHDVRSAVGAQVEDIASEVWADSVDEVVTVMYPRQVRLDRTRPVPYAVSLVATDAGTAWQLGEGDPVAIVAGPARELALLLWRRAGLEDQRLTITGDRAAAAQTLGCALTP